MWYISPTADASGNYGNPHFPAREGDLELPAIFVEDFVDARGFVNITAADGVVTAVEKNTEAYEAYMAEHPDTPAPPTELERLEAQILWTALETGTLLEDYDEA
jgi:hypothetical protein